MPKLSLQKNKTVTFHGERANALECLVGWITQTEREDFIDAGAPIDHVYMHALVVRDGMKFAEIERQEIINEYSLHPEGEV